MAEIPQTGDAATDAAITAFESELSKHCAAKNWLAVGAMLSRAAVMFEIAEEFYELDKFMLESLFGKTS